LELSDAFCLVGKGSAVAPGRRGRRGPAMKATSSRRWMIVDCRTSSLPVQAAACSTGATSPAAPVGLSVLALGCLAPPPPQRKTSGRGHRASSLTVEAARELRVSSTVAGPRRLRCGWPARTREKRMPNFSLPGDGRTRERPRPTGRPRYWTTARGHGICDTAGRVRAAHAAAGVAAVDRIDQTRGCWSPQRTLSSLCSASLWRSAGRA